MPGLQARDRRPTDLEHQHPGRDQDQELSADLANQPARIGSGRSALLGISHADPGGDGLAQRESEKRVSFVSDDRWTCPQCQETTVFSGAVTASTEQRVMTQLYHSKKHGPVAYRRGLVIQFPTLRRESSRKAS